MKNVFVDYQTVHTVLFWVTTSLKMKSISRDLKSRLSQKIDSLHIVISLSNRSSIEKSIKLFLKMKGQIAYLLHCKTHSDAL